MKHVNIAGHTVTLVTTRPAGFKTVAWMVIDHKTVILGEAPSAVYPKARLEAEVKAAVRAARKAARKARMTYDAPVRQRTARIYATPVTPATPAPQPIGRLEGYKTQRLPTGPKAKAIEVHVTTDAGCARETVIADFIRAATAAGYAFEAKPVTAELFCVRKSGKLRWIVKGKARIGAS